MFPSTSSSSNKLLLREILNQSLQESLLKVPSSSSLEAQLPHQAGVAHAMASGVDARLLLQRNASTGNTISSSLAAGTTPSTGFPSIPVYAQTPFVGTRPPLHEQNSTGVNIASCSSSLLLRQLRAANALKQHQLLLEEEERQKLQRDSYLALLHAGSHESLRSKAAAMAYQLPSPPQQPAMALEGLLLANTNRAASSGTGSLVPQSTNVMLRDQTAPVLVSARGVSRKTISPPPSPNPSTPTTTRPPNNALQALGGSLRKRNDPYIDVSALQDPDPHDTSVRRTRGGVSTPFPEKLHQMLVEVEKEGKTDIVSFFSHGRAFGVHDMDRFVTEIMPLYFKQSKWNSFARQLNLYGFIRINQGPDDGTYTCSCILFTPVRSFVTLLSCHVIPSFCLLLSRLTGGYYHELFLKGRPNLCFHMRRVGVPHGQQDRRKIKAKQETPDPDFYAMKPLPPPNDFSRP